MWRGSRGVTAAWPEAVGPAPIDVVEPWHRRRGAEQVRLDICILYILVD